MGYIVMKPQGSGGGAEGQPFSWNMNDFNSGIEIKSPYLVGGGCTPNRTYSNIAQPLGRGFGPKVSGKWQYSVKCTVAPTGSNTNNAQTTARFGLCGATKPLDETFGAGALDYALGIICGDSTSIYALHQTSIITNGELLDANVVTVGTILTVLVDLDNDLIAYVRDGVIYGPTYQLTANQAYYPACGFSDNGGGYQAGQYEILTALPYASWNAFKIWTM